MRFRPRWTLMYTLHQGWATWSTAASILDLFSLTACSSFCLRTRIVIRECTLAVTIIRRKWGCCGHWGCVMMRRRCTCGGDALLGCVIVIPAGLTNTDPRSCYPSTESAQTPEWVETATGMRQLRVP